MGLDNSIWKCLQEEATIYGFTGTPEKIQEVHQRKLVIAKQNSIIGPKIDKKKEVYTSFIMFLFL